MWLPHELGGKANNEQGNKNILLLTTSFNCDQRINYSVLVSLCWGRVCVCVCVGQSMTQIGIFEMLHSSRTSRSSVGIRVRSYQDCIIFNLKHNVCFGKKKDMPEPAAPEEPHPPISRAASLHKSISELSHNRCDSQSLSHQFSMHINLQFKISFSILLHFCKL